MDCKIVTDEPVPDIETVSEDETEEGEVIQVLHARPSWAIESPISESLDVWPLAGQYHLRWGKDQDGVMWVAVENQDNDCRFYQKYDEYLDSVKRKKTND